MKLTFRIEYRTAWGEELGVILDGNNSEPIILRTPNGEHWEGEAEMPDLPACVPVSYRYGVYRDGQCIRRESGTMAHLFCPGKKKNCHYILNDFWKDLPAESYLYSSAFSGDYQSEAAIKVTASADGSITFRALCPCLHHKHQVLAISGDCPALGNWDIQKTVLMEEIQPNEWTITLNVSTLEFPLSYKFVTCNADSKQVEEWENHDNRMLNNPELKKGEIYLTPETEDGFPSGEAGCGAKRSRLMRVSSTCTLFCSFSKSQLLPSPHPALRAAFPGGEGFGLYDLCTAVTAFPALQPGRGSRLWSGRSGSRTGPRSTPACRRHRPVRCRRS